jgi:alginate O-acetyltransferase complex protein AlgJ
MPGKPGWLKKLLTEKLSSNVAIDSKAEMSRIENLVVANLFLATIFVMALIGLSIALRPCPQYSEQEKRALAQFPVVNGRLEQLYYFAPQFESFYNDHFPIRLALTSFENMLDYRLFHTSGRSICAFGNKDWIIYAMGLLPTAQQNLNRFEDDQLSRWQAMYQARRDILASKNIKYVLIIAPEKGTIYPEFMPNGWSRRPGYSRLEQLQSALRTSHVDFVNAAGLLSESKRVGKWLYFSNDSHWNFYGAFQVAQSLFSLLEKDFDQVKPFSLSEFNLENAEHVGDLAIALTLQNMLVDKKSPTVQVKRGIAGSGSDNVKEVKVDLPIIREADSQLIEIPRAFSSATALPRAFVQHDSFMAYLLPYLSERFSFSEYHAVHTLSPKVIFERKPDVVIDEIAERHLYDRSPESVPLFISGEVDTEHDNLNVDFGDRLKLKSVWSRWTNNGLLVQMLWVTKKEQILDTAIEVSASSGKVSCVHEQDFYRRKIPAQTQFVDSFTLPLTDNSLKQTLKICVKSPAFDADVVEGEYQFALIKSQNKQSPIAKLKSSYSCPGEIFNQTSRSQQL